MAESNSWEPRRYVTLLAVLGLHAVLFAGLLFWPSPSMRPAPPAGSVALLMLAPADIPKIVPENPRLQRLTGYPAVAIAPPVLDSVSQPPSVSMTDGSTSDSNGDGRGVDWAAEAHRAIQAFEIRNHQPQNDISLSGSPAEEQWWPRTRRRPGDKFKTANGDWIVWITSNCYQVASDGAHDHAPGAAQPPTLCLGEPSKPRAGSID